MTMERQTFVLSAIAAAIIPHGNDGWGKALDSALKRVGAAEVDVTPDLIARTYTVEEFAEYLAVSVSGDTTCTNHHPSV